jgi:endonuclease YncB( thermonuclease family)
VHPKSKIPWLTVLIGVACLWALGTPALADPCKAIPDKGPKPAWIIDGATFEGAIRYVGDGDSLWVGEAEDPTTWLEVRLADFDAPELADSGGPQAAATLRRIGLGKHVWCSVTRGRNGRTVSFDRVIAVCRLGRGSLGDLMRAEGVAETR